MIPTRLSSLSPRLGTAQGTNETRSSTKYDRVKRAASVYACVRACSFSPRAPWCVRESREGELTCGEVKRGEARMEM